MLTADHAGLTADGAGAADIVLAQPSLWRRAQAPGVEVWFRGYLSGSGNANVDAQVVATGLAEQKSADFAWLRQLNGHFAVLAKGADWSFAAVDHVRSIPLFYGKGARGWVIADHARSLARQLGLGRGEIDPEAARLFALSGFLLGRDTLYRGLRALQAGECAAFPTGAGPSLTRYYVYRPRPHARSGDALRGDLKTLTLAGLEQMQRSCAGREIVVPLSAGLDSRLIASGLKFLGARNVRCFAYGRPGNFEAAASRAIAEALGYRWSFVPTPATSQRDLFRSQLFGEYLEFADTFTATPFAQDFGPVAALRRDGFAPPDAVFVNGQTGDYLSGNHIPASLAEPGKWADVSDETRRRCITDALIQKHYGLWESLHTGDAVALLRRRLWDDIAAAGGALGEPSDDFALYELSEWQNRQAKYVVGGQRIYDFFRQEWRLPLWDVSLMGFWLQAPLEAKFRQRLYREMLEGENWGGVWGPAWRFRYRVRPKALAVARTALKLACAPFGQSAWHRLERRFLAWHQDVLANYAIVPWRRVATDARGHRNAISWHTEAYLAAKGFGLDGKPLAARA